MDQLLLGAEGLKLCLEAGASANALNYAGIGLTITKKNFPDPPCYPRVGACINKNLAGVGVTSLHPQTQKNKSLRVNISFTKFVPSKMS